MKTRLLSAIVLSVVLLASCSESEKIKALEEKLDSLQKSQAAVPVGSPELAQTTTNADPSTLGVFQFSEMEYDFGTIQEGKVIERVFNFTNNGQAPLVISNITASCGCTSPDWTKAPVQPGETGFVKVVFNSAAKSGAQSPTVTIQANTNPSVTRLSMRGSVTPKTAGGAAQTGPLKK